MLICVETWNTNTVVHYCAIYETSQCPAVHSVWSRSSLRSYRRLLLVATPSASVTLRSLEDMPESRFSGSFSYVR